MNFRIAMLWAISSLVTGVLTAAAQRPTGDARVGAAGALITEAPTIVSGPDLGFRIERTRDGIALGKIVVRVDGKWIDTGSSATVVPARR